MIKEHDEWMRYAMDCNVAVEYNFLIHSDEKFLSVPDIKKVAVVYAAHPMLMHRFLPYRMTFSHSFSSFVRTSQSSMIHSDKRLSKYN